MYFNEFFTPNELVEKMLSCIPEKLWNTHTKWLEPTCGEGAFVVAIFNKLFHHHSHSHYTEEERIQHIHNNLYMIDINPKNVEKTKKTMMSGSSCPHIFCSDFLSWQSELKFEVIIGNPPFQTPSTCYLNGSLRKGSGKKMYEKIIDRSLFFLKNEGHLCFICPSNLWSGSTKTYKKIIDNYFPKYIYLNAKKWFAGIGSNLSMCFFLISKEPRGTTLIESDNIYEIELKHINPVKEWTPENVRLLETYLKYKKPIFGLLGGETSSIINK